MNFDLGNSENLRKSLLSRAGYLVFGFVVLLNIAYNCLTEVGLNWQTLLSLSTDCLLYLGSVYVTFCAMADTARRDARTKDAYTRAQERSRRVTEAAKPFRRLLCGYIAAYTAQDLQQRQKMHLEVAGLSYDDYRTRLCRLSRRELCDCCLPRAEQKAIQTANRQRPLRLGADLLLSTGETRHRKSILTSPARLLAGRYTAALLPTTVFGLFSAQVIFAVQTNCDLRAVFVQSLLRIGLLSWTALRGYAVGERTILCDSVTFLEEKADFLEEFIEWATAQNGAAKNKATACLAPQAEGEA